MLEEHLHVESKRLQICNITMLRFFLAAIDAILSVMNHRFTKVSSKLLLCMVYLNPWNSFANFDVDKLVRLAEFMLKNSMLLIFCCWRVNLKTS